MTQEREDQMEDEEKIIAGRPDVNYPALLTKGRPRRLTRVTDLVW